MRYKKILLAGFLTLVPIIIFAELVYYFNQDICPVGTFFCENITYCMPQRSWCNEENSCPQKNDKNISDCQADDRNNWEWFLKDQEKLRDSVCDPSHCPKEKCKCENCLVMCEGYREIPQNLSPNVTTISLSNNLLKTLTNDFTRYTEIRTLVLSSNKIKELSPGHFFGLLSLETLLADNNQISRADFSDLENSTSLEWINLSNNTLTHDNLILPHLPALKKLLLNDNEIEKISSNFFSPLPSLNSLNLERNNLLYIDFDAFENLNNLIELNIAFNYLTNIPENLFFPLQRLSKLIIGYNPIDNLEINVLKPLKNLRTLGMENINIENTEKNVFDQFENLKSIYFKKFYYCTNYAANVEKCFPVTDGISSLSHLLEKSILRAAIWGIAIITCLGNALVLWGRFTAKNENRVLSIMIKNLAVSDFLMGLYLLTIGFEDISFRNTYNKDANIWMSSWSCTLLGVLAMTSSEVSVLILSFISIERFIIISAPFKSQQRALTPQAAVISMIIIWVFGVTLALTPAIYWNDSTRFYGLNGMCFPLHIDDRFIIGWQYSAFIFLGINLFGLIANVYVYLRMFFSIWRTRNNTSLPMNDSEFAMRFFLIVFTEAVCWAPIIFLKIFVFLENSVAPDLHAWLIVFILPVNSAINPLLYTFTTPKFRQRLNKIWWNKIYKSNSRRTSDNSKERSSDVIMYGNKKSISPISTVTK